MASKITFKSWTCKVSIVIFFLNIKKLAAVDCGLLTNPVNKTQLYRPKDTIIGWRAGLGSVCYLNGSTSEGSMVQFTCAEGHYVYGNKYAKCRNDGKWGIDGRGLKCQPMVCERPHFDIENGKVHTFLDYYGQYILYSIYWVTCDFGYKPNGDAIRVCLVNDPSELDGTNNETFKGIWSRQNKTGNILPGGDTVPTCIKDDTITSCNTTGLIGVDLCRSLISNNPTATANETDPETNKTPNHSNNKNTLEPDRKYLLFFLVIFAVCYAIGFIGTIRLGRSKCCPTWNINIQRCKDLILYGLVRPLGHFLLPWYFYQRIMQEHENNNQPLREDFENWTHLNNKNKDLKTEMEKHCQNIRNITNLLKLNEQLRTDENNWKSNEKVYILMRIEKIDGLVTSFNKNIDQNSSPGDGAAVESRDEDQPLLVLPNNHNDIQLVLNQLREKNDLIRHDNENNERTLDEIKKTIREIDPMSVPTEPTNVGSFLYFIGQLKGIMGDYTNPLIDQTRGDPLEGPSTSDYHKSKENHRSGPYMEESRASGGSTSSLS